jgi:polysaccharide biosynthesis transport protein
MLYMKPAQAIEPVASSWEFFGEFVGLMRRQLLAILTTLALAILLGFVYLRTTPAQYIGKAAMIIEEPKNQIVQQPSPSGNIAVDSAMVESQVEILKSETIAHSVVKQLNLTEDSEFVGRQGGLVKTVIQFLTGSLDADEPPSEQSIEQRTLKAFGEGLTVKRVGLAYVLEIRFESLSPDRAAQIANAVANTYIADQLDARVQAMRRARSWMQDRITELREQASRAERSAVEFKITNNIINAGGRLLSEQQLAELNSQLINARAQTGEARARLDRIDKIIRAGTPDATVTDTLHSDVVSKLRSQYLELANREAEWATLYGADHAAVVQLRNQMHEIGRSIVDELKRLAQTFRSDFEIADQRQKALEKSMSEVIAQVQATDRAQVELRDLETTAQTYRALHDNFLQRYIESAQQESFSISEARLITVATPPQAKSHPNSLLVLGIASSAGMILGFGIGMLRDSRDRVFSTGKQVGNVG